MRLSNSLSMSLPISAWVTAAWLAWVLGTALFRWAMAPESAPVRWPWLRLALGPMLFGASALAMSFTGGDGVASWLAALGTIVCLMRLLYRWPGVGKLPARVWPLILIGMHLAAVVPSQIRWVLLAGAAAWIADCARHWRQLRALATGRA